MCELSTFDHAQRESVVAWSPSRCGVRAYSKYPDHLCLSRASGRMQCIVTTVYWSASQPTWCADCSRCSVRRHDSSTTCDRTTTSPMATVAACLRTRAVQVLTYKVLHDSTPRYLGPLVAVADQPGRRALRSASTSRLVIPPIKLSTVGSRAFPVAAAQVWNSLPETVISSSSLQSFRRQLKIRLFQLSYLHLSL